MNTEHVDVVSAEGAGFELWADEVPDHVVAAGKTLASIGTASTFSCPAGCAASAATAGTG